MSDYFIVDKLEFATVDSARKEIERGNTLRLKVLDSSMMPFIGNCDIVQIRSSGIADLKPGDIVFFQLNQSLYLRRLISTKEIEHNRYLITRADALSRSRQTVSSEQLLGKIFAIEKPKRILQLDNRLWRFLSYSIAKFPLFVFFFSLFFRITVVTNKILHPLSGSNLGESAELIQGIGEKYNEEQEVLYHSKEVCDGFEQWEKELVERFMQRRGRVLDIGCGAGREAIALAKNGFEVTGIDLAPGMVTQAIRNAKGEGLDIKFEVKSVTELDYPEQSFDYVLFSRGVYSYIPTKKLRIKTLERIKKVIKSGGFIALSVCHSSFYYKNKRSSGRYKIIYFLRRLLSYLSGKSFKAEPGDALHQYVSIASIPEKAAFIHFFPNAKVVLEEIEAAGLMGEEWKGIGFWIARAEKE